MSSFRAAAVLLALAVVAVATPEDRSFLTISDCVARGFFPAQLSCSTCSVVDDVAGDPSFARDCQSCCRNDDLWRHAPFDSAKLVTMKSGAQGGVGEFLEKHLSKFEDLVEVEDVFTPDPRIILIKKDKSVGGSATKASSKQQQKRVEFGIASWKTEHIEEFIRTFVKGVES